MSALLVEDLLKTTPVLSQLSDTDRHRLAAVARARTYARGETIFKEGDPPDFYYTIASGRVKVFRNTPAGKDIVLEVFGPGDPFGAVAVYEGRPFPATAAAIQETTCVLVPRLTFFELLEQHPSFVRGLLLGLTRRLVELTYRMAELTGGRVEPRFARLFLRLADSKGRAAEDGVFVPLALSRQDLAGMTGTTVETCIRVMSRWSKDGLVKTQKDGFTILDRGALEDLAML